MKMVRIIWPRMAIAIVAWGVAVGLGIDARLHDYQFSDTGVIVVILFIITALIITTFSIEEEIDEAN